MPKHTVIGGAAAYQDSDGHERWAYQGDVIDLTASEAERLAGLGMLHDEAAARERVLAAERELQAARDAEDQARADERERVAGETAAAGSDGDEPPRNATLQALQDAVDEAGIDPGDATTRKQLWALLPQDARDTLA